MNKRNDNFELKLRKLEEIVEKLESEDTSLEDSLKLFEHGVEISKELNEKLLEIKGRIEMVKKDAEGKIKLQELEN